MSTYGNKALINWDYANVDVSRFVMSDKRIQLAILEKWYPIGEPCHYKGIQKSYKDSFIESYAEYSNFYTVVLLVNDNSTSVKLDTSIGKLTMYRMIRDLKLSKLINNI